MSCMVAVCCWCLRAVAAVSRGVTAVESWRRGGRVVEVKFAAVAVGAREQRAARCDGPHTAVRARSARGHRIVPLRCSTSIATHPCGCFAAVSLQAELRAAFLRAVFALVAVKLVQKGDEPLSTTNKRVCGRWDGRVAGFVRAPYSADLVSRGINNGDFDILQREGPMHQYTCAKTSVAVNRWSTATLARSSSSPEPEPLPSQATHQWASRERQT